MALDNERSGIEKKFFDLSLSIVTELGLSLYDLEYITGQGLLRLFIRNLETDTATLDECAQVDRALGPGLEEPWVPETLTLEVSSPGVFRRLKALGHFKESEGKRVCLELKKKLTPGETPGLAKKWLSQKKILGELKNVADEEVIITVEGLDITLQFQQIKKANLEPDLFSGDES